jgi:hypothetical protein
MTALTFTKRAKELDDMANLCKEYKRKNIMLRAKLRAIKSPCSTTKRNLREQLAWDGEEANLADSVLFLQNILVSALRVPKGQVGHH